jgi:hypothetical protein
MAVVNLNGASALPGVVAAESSYGTLTFGDDRIAPRLFLWVLSAFLVVFLLS